ncbi:hypothetical protein V9T40_000289 [Parthenolecanium corni]|uniref:Vacuolar fusion protein CCZ1 n=1 Tax=Parthenolecanium corni TaxID=536013 RepID=A0AAN9T9J1_9HEMI
MQERVDASLNNFYIFNPTFGTTEGEEENKILFFHPPDSDTNNQIKTVGLSEAIIKFTRNFVSQEECKSVHTLKTRQYFYQAQPNYWMVMTVNVPYTKSKNGLKETVYHGENVQDDVYHSILKQAYEMYQLFYDSFQPPSEIQVDLVLLKEKISQFYSKYLQILKISNCDIVDVFQGIQFLPLDKKTYLHAQSFMNQFQCIFHDQVVFSALLVKEHLVWSNIELTDLRTIYRYLITTLLSSHLTENQNGAGTVDNSNLSEMKSGNGISYLNEADYSRFITCPSFYSNIDSEPVTQVPRLILRSGDRSIFQLLVYKVMSSFVCLFVPDAYELTLEFMRSIESFLRSKLIALASELSMHLEKKRFTKGIVSSVGHTFSYVYFNRLNLAQKNTLRDHQAHLTAEVLSMLADISFDSKKKDSVGETIVKTYDDFWIIGQFCNEREFYVVTQQKNSTLIEISDEMKIIRDKQLKSIYFHV